MLLAHHYCIKCGAANSDERKTCFACGISLKATRPLLSTYATTGSGQLAERQMLKGRYRILAHVGEGGFATVYRAEDAHNNDLLVAIGAARRYDARKSKDTIAFGSPDFAAPEQYGRAQTTARSDIYSLGALLHHLITGIDPALSPFHFEPLSAEQHEREVKALDGLLRRMVEMDMSKRPATAKEVSQELALISTQATKGRSAAPPRRRFMYGKHSNTALYS